MSKQVNRPLRKTPPPNPTTISAGKLTVARISSGIGVFMLSVAALAYLIQQDLSVLVLVCTIIGVGGITLWTVLAPGDLRTLIIGRQARFGSNSVLAAILVIGIVTISYVLASAFPVAADLTELHYYELKNDADKIVKNLDRPIIITAFYNASRLQDEAIDAPILNMFRDANPQKVKISIVDPDEQPLIAQKFGLNGAYAIYVSATDASGNADSNLTVPMRAPVAREQSIAEAIQALLAKGKYKVLFTIGHDELGTDIVKKEDAYGIRAGMENVGIVTDTLDLQTEAIPAGTSAVVMLGPQRDLSAVEVSQIKNYMDHGGKLLIMAKPAYVGAMQFMVSPDSPMVKYLWSDWGIRPQHDIVFDPSSFLQDPYRLLAAKVDSSIMSRDSAGSTQIRPLLTIAQSWELNQILPDGVTATPIIYSSDKSVGKTNVRQVATNPDDPANLTLQAGDLAGPLIMAAALENPQKNARLIVIGDSDWVFNDAVVQFDGDILWTNMIDWLTRYLSNIQVQPTAKQLPLIADTASLNLVAVITLAVLPGLVLLTGALVWWNRARRQ
jgi:ABC-type uncharacterized transport system involved in gliding motility auxiliary subunit